MKLTKTYSINGNGAYKADEVAKIVGISYGKVHEIGSARQKYNGYTIRVNRRKEYDAYVGDIVLARGCKTIRQVAEQTGYSESGFRYRVRKGLYRLVERWYEV